MVLKNRSQKNPARSRVASSTWGSLKPKKLVDFFKLAKTSVSGRNSNHHHVVFFEPQTVSTLGVYRVVHEKPLDVDTINHLKKTAFAAGMHGQYREVPVSEGRTGSLEFRFSGEDESLIQDAFRAAHRQNVNHTASGFEAQYRFA